MGDIAGGNVFGTVTCLVRRAGVIDPLPNKIPGVTATGQKLREELKKPGIWHKHNQHENGDQYYPAGGEVGIYISSE